MGTLFDDPYVLDDEGEKQRRQKEADDFFGDEVPVDDGPYSWETFRRQAREGLVVADRNLIPYVTYIPKLLNEDNETEGDDENEDGEEQSSDLFSESLATQGTIVKYEDESTELDEDGLEYTVQSFLGLAKKKALHKSFMEIENEKNKKLTRDDFNENMAATYIQKVYRGRMAKKVVRKLLCQTWCKKNDSTPGIKYYLNIHTGETRWVPPRLMRRLMPNVQW
jgi:hypothetical protein